VDSDTLKRQHLERLRASVRGAELAGEGRVLRGLRYWESRWLKLPDWSRSGRERGVTPEERRAILDEAREANRRALAHQAFDWANGRLFLEEEMDKDAGASGRRGLLQRFRSSLRRTASSRGRSRSREDGVDRVDSVGVSARRGLGGGVGQAFSGDDDELDPGNNRPPNASRFGRRGRPAATDIEEGGGNGIRGGAREGLLPRRRKGGSKDGSSSSSDDGDATEARASRTRSTRWGAPLLGRRRIRRAEARGASPPGGSRSADEEDAGRTTVAQVAVEIESDPTNEREGGC